MRSWPVIAECTVEHPARHQILVPLCPKDRSKEGCVILFFPARHQGGVLQTKTVVQPSKEGSFVVKADNLNFQKVTLFKGQKIGTLSGNEEVLNFAHGD